jgi:hypothetical protein
MLKSTETMKYTLQRAAGCLTPKIAFFSAISIHVNKL